LNKWLRVGIPVMAAVLLAVAVIGAVMPVNADYASQRPADVKTSSYRGACGGSCMDNDGDEGATCPNSDNGACYGQSGCPGGGMMGSGITGRGMMGRGTAITGGGASCH
jgi:hypothetical protein